MEVVVLALTCVLVAEVLELSKLVVVLLALSDNLLAEAVLVLVFLP